MFTIYRVSFTQHFYSAANSNERKNNVTTEQIIICKVLLTNFIPNFAQMRNKKRRLAWIYICLLHTTDTLSLAKYITGIPDPESATCI